MRVGTDDAIDDAIDIGSVPEGRRSIVPILGGTFEGDRLRGTVRAMGSDWTVDLADGSQQIDVRTVLDTDDGVPIALTYRGRFHAPPNVMEQLRRGEPVDANAYELAAHFAFQSGDDRYAWLNTVQAIGAATFGEHGPVYTLYSTSRRTP